MKTMISLVFIKVGKKILLLKKWLQINNLSPNIHFSAGQCGIRP